MLRPKDLMAYAAARICGSGSPVQSGFAGRGISVEAPERFRERELLTQKKYQETLAECIARSILNMSLFSEKEKGMV